MVVVLSSQANHPFIPVIFVVGLGNGKGRGGEKREGGELVMLNMSLNNNNTGTLMMLLLRK
jgi:hypothetical protein